MAVTPVQSTLKSSLKIYIHTDQSFQGCGLNCQTNAPGACAIHKILTFRLLKCFDNFANMPNSFGGWHGDVRAHVDLFSAWARCNIYIYITNREAHGIEHAGDRYDKAPSASNILVKFNATCN